MAREYIARRCDSVDDRRYIFEIGWDTNMARKPRSRMEDGGSESGSEMTVEARLASLEGEIEDINLTGAVQAKDIQSLRARVEQLKEDMEDIAEGASAEDLARIEGAMTALEGRLQDVESSVISRTADIEAGRAEVTRVGREASELKAQLEELQNALEERIVALKEELGESETLVRAEAFEKSCAEIDERIAQLGSEAKHGQADLKASVDELVAELRVEMASLSDEQNAAVSMGAEGIDGVKGELDKLRAEFEELASASSSDEAVDALRQEVIAVKESLEGAGDLAQKAKEALPAVEALAERVEGVAAQVTELSQKTDELTQRAAEAENQSKAAAEVAEEAASKTASYLESIKVAMRLVESLDEKVRSVSSVPLVSPPVQAAAAVAATVATPAAEEEDVVIPPIAEDLGYDLADILAVVVKHGASDLHLKAGTPPTVRLHGDLVPVGDRILTPDDAKALIYSAMTKAQRLQLSKGKEVDFAYASEDARYRVNAFLERGNVSAAFRMLRSEIPAFDSLGLPPVLKRLASLDSGLILVTGPAGSGKSTTLAAVVDYINASRKCHVVTVEDPIEFFHKDKLSIITQREVGADTSSFNEALKMSLRQDPNVIMVGEMRDPETMMMAVTAAETGHLVLSTLHTPNAVQAVDRIVDTFAGDVQRQFRLLLANSLRGVMSQKLLTRADGKGRALAAEVMVVTPTISSLILEGKTQDIYPYIQQGSNDGMQTFTQSMLQLYMQGMITKEEGLMHADQTTEFRLGVEGHSTATQTEVTDEALMNWL